MMSGKAIAAAIAFFTMPIISRLFSPADFGVAAVFLSIIGITSNVAALRYESAIVLPKSDAEALKLMGLCYRVAIVFCLLMLTGVMVLEALPANVAVMSTLGVWSWLLPLGTLLMVALQIQEAWLSRCRKFGVISSTVVAGTVINSSVRIGSGVYFGSSIFALIASNLFGMLSRLALQARASPGASRALAGRLGREELRRLSREYVDFPKLNAPAALVFSIGNQMPVLFFGAVFPPAIAGFFAMANRISAVPVTVVATSVRRVFLQKAAEVRQRGRSLRKAFFLTTGGLLLLGAPPFTILGLFGGPVTAFVLGEPWRSAGEFLEVMAPWLLSVWLVSPCNAVFIVLRRQRLWLFGQILLTAIKLLAFVLAYTLAFSALDALKAFVFASTLGNAGLVLLTWRELGRGESSVEAS